VDGFRVKFKPNSFADFKPVIPQTDSRPDGFKLQLPDLQIKI